jgi:undecaprenyl-diphosphatase
MLIYYIIIAILQGLFEWLPISSSGQTIIIATNFFGISQTDAFSLAIFLHLGTMLAVLVKFWKDFFKIFKACLPPIFKNTEDQDKKKRNWLIIGTIGTAITALPLYFIFKILTEGVFTAFTGDIITLLISILLIVTGIILLKYRKKFGDKTVEDVPIKTINKNSFIAGLVQGISILPGISRSGVTVSAVLGQKYEENTALKLSFLMSVPAVIASIMVDILFGSSSIFALDTTVIIIITLISFVVGYLTIEVLLRVAKKVNFGYFCIIYGIIAVLIITPFLIISLI